MDLGGSDRQPIWKAFAFMFWIACALLMLNNCSQDSGSRIRVELHDVLEQSGPARTASKPEPPNCPPGDPVGNDASSTPAGAHTVKLSWTASTSATGPNAKEIFYCLYRTKGGPVQTNTGAISPCIKCQRVTKQAIPETQQPDTRVEDGAHYCYVAIAIDSRSGKSSVLSSQADAVIPPNKEQPFCNPQNGNLNKDNGRKQSGHH